METEIDKEMDFVITHAALQSQAATGSCSYE
ncbi:hypothetical protein T09_8717 [Trichinella sp. T9]|nr:hypothetical protein T09_8717 [Trichinella sp. T9]